MDSSWGLRTHHKWICTQCGYSSQTRIGWLIILVEIFSIKLGMLYPFWGYTHWSLQKKNQNQITREKSLWVEGYSKNLFIYISNYFGWSSENEESWTWALVSRPWISSTSQSDTNKRFLNKWHSLGEDTKIKLFPGISQGLNQMSLTCGS